MNHDGHAIRSNFSPEDTENYASLVSQVTRAARCVYLLCAH
jgi:hypothetical protein